MKTHLILFALVALAMGGCADQRSTTTTSTDPSRRTYTNQELNNTGRHDSADALQAADPSVTVSSGGRR